MEIKVIKKYYNIDSILLALTCDGVIGNSSIDWWLSLLLSWRLCCDPALTGEDCFCCLSAIKWRQKLVIPATNKSGNTNNWNSYFTSIATGGYKCCDHITFIWRCVINWCSLLSKAIYCMKYSINWWNTTITMAQ